MENGEDGRLSYEERKKSMSNSVADGMGYSIMSGFGDAYLPAAAIALGAGNFYLGLLSALPQLVGAVLQFFTLNILRFAKDRKLIVMAGALLQSLCWLPIIALLLWPGELSAGLVLVFFSLGSGISLMINPIWSSWITDIVPENDRPGFFANRNRLMQLVLFASTFATGIILQQLQLGLPATVAFAAVFAIPFLARLSTVLFHFRTSNVRYDLQLIREIRLKHLFLLPAHRNELWFLVFIAMMNFAVQFASPFFTPYMLNELHFDLGMLGIMTALSVLAKIVSYPYWGKAIDRFGNQPVLIATAFATPLVPLIWLLSRDTLMIGLFQVFSGFVWAGFDLSSFNSALSLVGRELRPSFISKYNMFAGVFNAAGAVAGGLFLASFGWLGLFGVGGILLVFMISGFMRLAAVLLFSPKLSSAGRGVENTTDQRAMVLNLVAVYPTQGAVHHALGGWDFTKKIVAKGATRGEHALKTGLGATGELLKDEQRKLSSGMSKKKRL